MVKPKNYLTLTTVVMALTNIHIGFCLCNHDSGSVFVTR